MAVEPNRIDYKKLADGLVYYESKGYSYLEVPWVVSREATLVTLPDERKATEVNRGDLVGSAEQSFIELMMRGQHITKACAITPCFRDEPDYDELHHFYFMKLELINTDATEANLQQMIEHAREFLAGYLDVKIISTGKDTYDIVSADKEIELGSYGFREFKGLRGQQRFIYGTGIALPRLDSARL